MALLTREWVQFAVFVTIGGAKFACVELFDEKVETARAPKNAKRDTAMLRRLGQAICGRLRSIHSDCLVVWRSSAFFGVLRRFTLPSVTRLTLCRGKRTLTLMSGASERAPAHHASQSAPSARGSRPRSARLSSAFRTTLASRSPRMHPQVRSAHRAMSVRPNRCFTLRIPSSEPIRLTRPMTGRDQPHIRSSPMRLHQNPACGGRGSGGRHHSTCRRLKPWS